MLHYIRVISIQAGITVERRSRFTFLRSSCFSFPGMREWLFRKLPEQTILKYLLLFFVAITVCFSTPNQAEEQRLLLKNAAMIVTMDASIGEGELGLIENGDLLIVGNRIDKVGQKLTDDASEVIDMTGRILLPGFVDVHNHLWNALMRGCAADADLYQWINSCQYPVLGDRAAHETVYSGVRLSTLDLINTGVTTTLDWMGGPNSAFTDSNLRALEESGIRFVYSSFRTVADEAAIKDIENIKQRLDKNSLGTLQIGVFLVNKEPFQSGVFRLAEFAKKYNLKVHAHLRENIGDKELGQMELLRQAGLIGPQLQIAHAIHLDDAEIKELAEAGVAAVHNPLSNMRLASGIMRLPKMLEAGMRVGLGLDGSVNDTSDMFNTMRIAIGLQRAKSLSSAIRPNVSDVLQMATIGGAQVLGLEQQIGSLTPGKQADIAVINPSMVNFAPRFEWLNQIVFNAQPVNVEWVFVGGQALKRNGRLVGDVDSIIAIADRDAALLKGVIDKATAEQAAEKKP